MPVHLIPAVDLNVVSGAGGNEWNGEVVPLNLGIRCSALPETGVGISLTVSPENADTGAGENIIASKKTTGINIAGPDLLLVDTGNPVTRVTFSPGLALPGGKCSGDISPGSGNCLEMSGNGSDYRIPLGVRVFIPATGGGGEVTRRDADAGSLDIRGDAEHILSVDRYNKGTEDA